MACELNVDAVKYVYGYVYGEISDRESGKNKNPLDIKVMMKDFYNYLNSLPNDGFESEEDKKEKALYFAQSIPQILGLVAARPKARDYILKTNTQLFIDIPTLASEYSDIKKVEVLVKPTIKTRKTAKKEVIEALEEKSVPKEDETKKYSYAEYASKVIYPNGTSGQEAVPIDPETGLPKNEKDPEKGLFYEVIKDIVYIVKSTTNDEVLYGEDESVSLALTLMPVSKADPAMFTSKDKIDQKTYGVRGIVAIITDTAGNEVYFNDDGSINRDGNGRRIYQFVRKPYVENGKLFFLNKYNKKTSLVPAEEVAENWAKQKRAQKIYPKKEEIAAKVVEIRNKQTKLFNDLLRLREYIESTEEAVTVKITDGSFGMSNDTKKFYPIQETGLGVEDLDFKPLGDDYPGRWGVVINKTRPGVTVDQLLLLQRSNISDDLAGHIADILTTKAKLKGRELTPQQRREFFENFINNDFEEGEITSPDKIQVKESVDENGQAILNVSINGEEPIPQNVLYTEKGRKLIFDHLKTAKTDWELYEKQTAKEKTTYSAALNYVNTLMGRSFTDYILDKSTNKLAEVEEDYFEFIKDKMLIQYPADTAAYFSGMNAYLNFGIPQNIIPANEQVYELGEPASNKEDNAPVKKAQNSEPNAKVRNVTKYQKAKDLYNEGKGTWGMRPATGLEPLVPFAEHVGNPWSTQKDALNKNVLIVKDVATAVKNYEDWLTGKKFKTVEQKRRKFILDAIEKGWFNNTTFIYYKPVGKSYRSHVDVLVDMINKRNRVESADIIINEPIEQPKPAPKKQAVAVKATVSSILNNKNRKQYLKRDVKLNSFFEKIFTTKKARDKAFDWWEQSFISQTKINGEAPISLQRLTEIANSDAVATFDKSGITLYKGSTNIDIYHEAWHAFSQLFLTPEEQESLYEDVLKTPKYTNKNYATKEEAYSDIEEDIAEDFRSFMKSEKFKESLPKFLRTIFERIGAFLRWAYGKVTRQDMTRPRDIPRVREMFEVLRTNKPEEAIKKGLFQSLNATTQNMSFTKLNRGKRTIQPIKANKNINEFTPEETMQIMNTMDGMAALAFQDYNLDHNSTVGYIRISEVPQNRIQMYEDMKDNFYGALTYYVEQLEEITLKNVNADEITPEDAAEEKKLTDMVDFIKRVVDNFGDIKLSLDKKQQTGVIAHHMKKSRFTMLKESYNEIEDTTSIEAMQMLKDASGNILSSKQVASEETLMLLSGLFKPERGSDGRVVRDEDGAIVYKRDMFGIPELEKVDDVWNKLAKILEGSYDVVEMHQRILDSMGNYPELEQLLNLLPQLAHTDIESNGYRMPTEFRAETNFWQDLKKPRIRYIQLNIDKEADDKFTAKLSKASMDVYAVTSEWEYNFAVANPSVNDFIEQEGGNNLLNLDKIINRFGKKSAMSAKDSIEFLKALGIELDLSSSTIRNMVFDPKVNFALDNGLNKMLDAMKVVQSSTNEPLKDEFRRNPLKMLREGLPVDLRKDKEKSLDVQARIRLLAEIQNEFSDRFSNFSVLNAERNRVWEHFVDNTITRVITSINKAETYQELTQSEDFKHMHWLAKKNNTLAPFSQLLNSVFYMKFDPRKPEQYGTKRKDAKLLLQNITGTQFITKNINETTGSNTSSMDAVGKFLQEYHTMLMNGVEEFMRHASKNMAMGLTVDRDTEIKSYSGKKNKKLYIDIDAFEPGRDGELRGAQIMLGYLSGEANRIFRFKNNINKFKNYAGYNREVKDKLGRTVMAGEAFTLFDDILTKPNQEVLYDIIQSAIDNNQPAFNMADILDDNPDLRDGIEMDIIKYFNLLTKENLDRLNENKYVDSKLSSEYIKKGVVDTKEDAINMLTKAYSYNSFIHKYETVILAYGDLAQYNHAKEEFHKRNAGLGSGGKGFRADQWAQQFINTELSKDYIDNLNQTRSDKNKLVARKYDGTFNTAIMKELKMNSEYYNEYLAELTKVYTERYGDSVKAKQLAEKVLKEYKNMKVADGQGYLTIEAYRNLKWLEGNWSDEQEALYKKISNGENISIEDAIQFFPPYKLQYFGNIKSEGLPVNSFHKFSLAPLIPGVAKEGTQLYDLHLKMMEQQIDYVTFETGSKVAHIGSGDEVFNEDGTFNNNVTFTPNVIYAEYLKNQTEINSSYKGVSIFSTQLRKMILEGLYENGEIKSKDKEFVKGRAEDYIRKVEFLTNIHKLQLLDEIGYEEVDGEFIPTSNASTEKIANMIRTNLEKDDLLSDDLIDFIDVYEKDNTLVNDLSFHPESAKIEKLLLSIINKKVIKQKVKGEALVQMSSAFFNNYSSIPAELTTGNKKQRDEIIKKYVGTNFLPTYHKKANGFTAAMKVMISMQGDYLKLFNLEYSNDETIGVYFDNGDLDMNASLERLNEKIKDDEWLDANNEANRKAITMMGVRIPVQGLNSMEFMEVYHFLPPQAGNIVIPPAEIVAKSGADYDIDKLTIFMTNLNESGNVKKPEYNTYKDFKNQYDFMKSTGLSTGQIEMFFEQQKAGVENELIQSMKNILELPDNYASLITPNSNYILEPIAEELSKYVMEYDPFANKMTEENVNTDGKKIISPTRILESLYNVYKHESNIVGKRTLGLGAIENTFNVIFNSLGAYMPNEYTHTVGKDNQERTAHLWLKHHKLNVDGKEHISISNMFDVNNEYKVADVLAQMINGWVDVEKDPWIFFIQGNYETAPILLYLLKTGVPVNEAVYFVSNPLTIEYIKEKNLGQSTFAELLGKKPEYKAKLAQEAAGRVIRKYFNRNELKMDSSQFDRYTKGVEMAEDYLEDRQEKTFTKDEMLGLIKNFKQNNGKLTEKETDLAKTMFLHFLEIEQQITGLTALKLSSNPDTATRSTASEIELSEASIDQLSSETKIPKELLTKMLNDSVISSFFNGPLSLAVIRPLFKLKYNKHISNYIVENAKLFRSTSSKLLGERKVDTFITMFRNDLINMIFQNAIRKYKMDDSYMSYTIKKEIPTALASELTSRGAFVKANKDGTKFMYIDEKTLREEFKSGAWEIGSEENNSYENRNMYALDPRTFKQNGKLNFELYMKFVAEREFLRSEYPINEMVNKSWFRREGLDLYEANPTVDGGTLGRFVYERYITNKALDNVYNFYHLFIDKNNALASRYSKFITQHKNSLLQQYDVLDALKYESNKSRSIFNIYLADKDMNSDKSNVYTMNLKNLSDRSVMKIADKDENDRISDMFALMSNFAFLQTGLNKTKLNFTNIVDFTNFLDVMKEESEKFTRALDANAGPILDDFFAQFKEQNSRKNIDSGRFKDYLNNIDLSKPNDVEVRDTEIEESPYELKETSMTNVFAYRDQLGNKDFYKGLALNNPDVVFIRNNVNTTYKDPKKNFGGQQELDSFAGNMTMNITTSLTKTNDNFANLPKTAYKDVIRLWEEEIAHIQGVNDGKAKLTKIAFPTTGFGDPALMPQELFVYLSRRLFDEFGYVNPGSVMYNEMQGNNTLAEGITNEEILEQLGLEEDPFKNCE